MAAITYTASDVQTENATRLLTAELGEAVAAGEAVFKDSDGLIYLANSATGSSGAAPDEDDQFGIAVTGGAAAQLCVVLWADGDSINFGSGVFTAGQWYVVGVDGAIMPASDLASGDYSILLGYASTDAILVLRRSRTGVQLA